MSCGCISEHPSTRACQGKNFRKCCCKRRSTAAFRQPITPFKSRKKFSRNRGRSSALRRSPELQNDLPRVFAASPKNPCPLVGGFPFRVGRRQLVGVSRERYV